MLVKSFECQVRNRTTVTREYLRSSSLAWPVVEVKLNSLVKTVVDIGSS